MLSCMINPQGYSDGLAGPMQVLYILPAGCYSLLQSLSGQGLSLLAKTVFIIGAISCVFYLLPGICTEEMVPTMSWCTNIILIIEFIILFPQFTDLSFSFGVLSGFILTFLITALIYSMVILFVREKMSNELHYNKYLRFKNNPDILRTLLLNQKHYDIPVTDASLVFGEKDAPLKITAFLSLHCSHCARALEKIKDMLRTEVKMAIEIVLVTYDSKILEVLYNFKRVNKNEKALETS